MDWREYKALCERPDHFSRWALLLTSGSVDDRALKEILSRASGAEPLPKPAGQGCLTLLLGVTSGKVQPLLSM
jgi:hypothetical protein